MVPFGHVFGVFVRSLESVYEHGYEERRPQEQVSASVYGSLRLSAIFSLDAFEDRAGHQTRTFPGSRSAVATPTRQEMPVAARAR